MDARLANNVRDLVELLRDVRWHPQAESLLWTPETQQAKTSQSGRRNVPYRSGFKGQRVRELTELIDARARWLRIRYAF